MGNKIVRKDVLCRICESNNIEIILKLNDTPLEDQFVSELNKQGEQDTFPLELAICKKCGYMHLPHIIDPKESYADYLYSSRTTPGLRSHYDEYARTVVENNNIKRDSLVVDLGSNDGSMLASFKKLGMIVIGVEPASQISEHANRSGIKTINDYFSNEVVSKIVEDYGKADVITANYMYANIDDIVSFTKSIEKLLSEDGLFVMETGYHPEQFKIKMFDYIYHEHFSYFTVGVLSYLFNKCNLEIIDVQKTKPKGGSIRVVSQKKGGSRKIFPSVNAMIDSEKEEGVYSIDTYKNLSNELQELKNTLIQLLKSIKNKGQSIVAFGASHSTTTLIYHFELSNYFDYIVDDNKVKHGLYSPGFHIPVFSTEKIYDYRPDHVLILAWQHQDSILKRHWDFVERGGKFIIPLPKIKVVEKSYITMIPWWKTSFGEDEVQHVTESIRNKNISQGKVTEKFECRLAEYLQVSNVIAVSSGTSAITMALMSIGIKPDDEVIVPNRTWIATAHAVHIIGAKVVLVDVELNRPIIDAEKIEEKITSKTRAILPVHMNGRSANMKRIKEISKKYNLYVVEDAAQALGSRNSDGYLGTQSDVGCFSLSVAKVISTGQGGFVVTNDNELADKMRAIRTHGVENVKDPDSWVMPGFNFRFTDIQASIGLEQLKRLPERIKYLCNIYRRYERGLNSSPFSIIPVDLSIGEVPVYSEFLVEDRKKWMEKLKKEKIETRPFYPSINTAEYLGQGKEKFVNSRCFCDNGLYLPSGPSQEVASINRCIESINRSYFVK